MRAWQGSGGRDAGRGQAPHASAEATDQRTEDPMLAVPGGTDGVSGIPLGTQLPPDRARGLHRFPPEQGERSEHLPQDQRVDIAAERTAVAGGNGRTTEPVHDRLGELLPPGASESGIQRDRPPRGPAAAPVAVSEAQGEVREVRAIPGPAAVRRVRSRAPGADDDKPSVGEGMICTESRMRENRTSGLTSGGRKRDYAGD